MAPTAALLQEKFKTARSGFRQPGNVFVNELSELKYLSSSHAKRPPHARNTGEGGASVSPQIYCGKISERAKRLERRLCPDTMLSAHELAYTLRISESTIWSILRGSKNGPSGRVLQLLVDFFGASFLHEVFSGPNVHCFDRRDGQRAEALRMIAEAQDELRVFLSDVELRPAPNLSLDRIDNNRGYETSNMRWTTKSVQQKSRRPSFEWRRAA
jgi:transcriptional regulator with XRE-family HTH domain